MASSKNIKNLIVENNGKCQRIFSYALGEEPNRCTLDFTLRTDTKTQLKHYAVLLKTALNDVRQELQK